MDNSQYPDDRELEKRGLKTSSSTTSRARRGPQRSMSAQVLRLAKRLGKDPDELAVRYGAETVRKLKYPVREEVHEDGSRTYHDDLDIREGRLSG